MSNDQIVRAWKDEHYRSSLSEAERDQLPPHPAGFVELTEAQLDGVSGGFEIPHPLPTIPCTVLFSMTYCKT